MILYLLETAYNTLEVPLKHLNFQSESGLITYCLVTCSASSKILYITALVNASKKMGKLGFKDIVIQRSSDKKLGQLKYLSAIKSEKTFHHMLLTAML